MTFGKRLRYLREERELRQQDVAREMKVSTRMLGYYESDQHFPSDAQMIIDMARFFNVSIDYLFGVSNIKNKKTLDEFNSVFAELSEADKKSALDYISYLRDRRSV